MNFPKYLMCVVTLISAGSLLLCGCNKKPTGPVRHESGGIVLFKGKPVPKAQVVFFGPGISRGAITGEDGRFEVKAGSGNGLPAGDYEISVRPAPGGDTEIINFDRPDIPKKYWSKETSGLKESIVDGKNELKLEL